MGSIIHLLENWCLRALGAETLCAANRAELISEGDTKYLCKLYSQMTAALHYSNLREFVTGRRLSAPPLMPDGVNNAAWSLLCPLVCVFVCVFSVSLHREFVFNNLTTSTLLCEQVHGTHGYVNGMGLCGYKPCDQSSTILFQLVEAHWTFQMDYSGWLAVPKQQINEFMAFSRYLDLGAFNAEKRIKRVEIRINQMCDLRTQQLYLSLGCYLATWGCVYL